MQRCILCARCVRYFDLIDRVFFRGMMVIIYVTRL